MTMYEFLSDRMGQLVFRAVFAISGAIFLLVTGTQAGIVILMGIFWLIGICCVQAVDFFRCHMRFQELENIMNGLDRKSVV